MGHKTDLVIDLHARSCAPNFPPQSLDEESNISWFVSQFWKLCYDVMGSFHEHVCSGEGGSVDFDTPLAISAHSPDMLH